MALTTPALLESWQLALHNKRQRTITLYLDEMARFAAWLEANQRPDGNHGSLLDVTRDDARAWINAMQTQGLSPNTIRNRWVAARSLYRWLVDEEELEVSPFAKVVVDKPDTPPPDVLTETQLRDLLRACDGKTFLDKRDYALIRFMLATGLRRAEVIGVRTDDLDLAGRVVVIPDGKGGKFRAVRFDPVTASALDRYRRARARHAFASLPWFWVTHQGRLTVKGLPSVITKRAGLAGLKGLHPHQFRHSWAHRLKLAGMSDENVRQLGGWESNDVMRRYGQALAADRARARLRRRRPDGRPVSAARRFPSTPDVSAGGRCASCAAKHHGRTPTLIVTVNFGPGDREEVYWHGRRGAAAAATEGTTARHTAAPDFMRPRPAKCHGCQAPLRIGRKRLISTARAALSTAVNGKCEFLI